MTDTPTAPERIWADTADEFGDIWQVQKFDGAIPYVRADIADTLTRERDEARAEVEGAHLVLQDSLRTNADLWEEVERLREALTPSADTKAEYMGEFRVGVRLRHPRTGEEDHRSIDVPWTVIKEIMAAIRTRAALAQTPEGTDAT